MNIINQSHINFFKQKLNIDVSNVKVNNIRLEESAIGEFNTYGEINVDIDKIKRIYKRATTLFVLTTVAHELVHLCQFEYNKSAILPINNIFTANILHERYESNEWHTRPLEIDAMIMEVYYVYSTFGVNDSIRGFTRIRCSRVGISTLIKYASRLNDRRFTRLVASSFDSQFIKLIKRRA